MSIKYSQEQLKNLSQKELITLIQTLTSEKKYGLVWEDFEEPTEEGEISVDILEKLCINLEAKDNIETKKHCIIEGDNLHSLKYLQEEFTNKVDVIYIDPPYNTGNEFVYNDKIVDKKDNFRHSKWLSFMHKRLKLAKQLLSEDGVIFVSIDDNEQAQLKLLMDEVFGEQNFVSTSMWLHGKGKKTKQIRTLQQYTLIYAKDLTKLDEWVDFKIPDYDFSNPDSDSKGEWFSGSISFTEKRSNPNSKNFYSVKSPSGVEWVRQWQVTEDEMTNLISNGDIYFGESPLYNKVPRLKVRKTPVKIIPTNIVDNKGTTRSASTHLNNLLGMELFSYPKPVELICHYIKILDKNKDITVLDFFAGSGTTGHAVMELNKEDGGNRKFILCTNNEVSEEKVRNHFIKQGLLGKNTKTAFNTFYKENEQLVNDFYNSEEYQQLGIARSVTYERLKRVIEGYVTPKGKEVEGIKDNSVLYLCATNKNKEENVK